MFVKFLLFVCVILVLGLIGLPDRSYGQNERKLTQPESQKKVSVKSKNSEVSDKSDKSNKNAPKKVMIVDFDARGLKQWWQGNWDIGNLFANSIVGPMSRTSSFEVVERERMKEIFAEQDISGEERFKQSSITKVGRLLGADLIMFGYLTDFSRKRKSLFLYTEVNAQIRFSVRLVDVATGKVVNSVEISYNSPKQKERPILANDKEVDPNDPEFLQSMFGQAIVEASKLAVEQLSGEKSADSVVVIDANAKTGGKNNSQSNSTPSPKSPLKAVIVDVSGKSVIITKGTNHGVSAGQIFAVVKVVKEVKNPDTQEVIFRKTEEIARIKITSAQAEAAEGEIISGTPNIAVIGTEVERVN